MITKCLVGDLLHCALCSAHYSIPPPGQESDWRLISFDSHVYAVCPGHFPPQDATVEQFTSAYEFIIRRLLTRACRQPLH